MSGDVAVLEGPPDEPWRSGERLRARTLTDGSGAAMFLYWHDLELGIDCKFELTEARGPGQSTVGRAGSRG